MRSKLKTLVLSFFWLSVSALVILAFAGIISSHPIKPERTNIKLTHKVTGVTNKAHEITFNVDGPISDLQASISLDTSNRHAIISTLQLPGNLENIHIDKDKRIAYLANSFSGLQIIDISDPEQLRIIGSLPSPGKAWDIKVRGNILFLASAKEGLHLVDISDLEAPTIISNLKLEGYSMLGLEIVGKTVYAKTGKNGLLIIDVSNTKAPQLVKKLYSDSGVWGLLIDKNRLYVSSGRFNLEILDVTNPNNPRIIERISLPGRVWDLAISAEVLYLPTRRAGLLIVDMRQPGRPELLRPTFDSAACDHIVLQHDRAYLTSRTGSLKILDISNLTAPKLIGIFDLPDRPRDITTIDQTAFVAAGVKGLQVIDTSTLTPTDQIKSQKVPGNLKKVLFDDNFFYLATRENGLYITEIDSSEEPGAIIAHLPLTGRINNMVRVDNHLYLACSQAGLLIVDIIIPAAPVLIGKPGFAKTFMDLVAVGNYLLLSDNLKNIFVVDVQSPENPTLISKFPLEKPRQLAIDDSYLYVSSKSSLYIIDYSTPSALTQVGKLDLPWPLQKFTNIKQITVAGNTLYLAAGSAGLISLDVSNPESPRLEEIITLHGDLHAVTVSHNNIFAITRQGKLWLLQRDSDNKTSHRAVIDTLGIGYDLLPYGERMLIANGFKGLTISPLPQQIEINNRVIKTGRIGTTEWITLPVPAQANPGIYNLNLLHQGELLEFVGAVELRHATE